MGIQISGHVLKVERRAGNFTNDGGDNIVYDFTIARVLVDDEVVEVKFKSDRPDVQPPAKGADIILEVELPRGTKPIASAYVSDLAGKRAAS